MKSFFITVVIVSGLLTILAIVPDTHGQSEYERCVHNAAREAFYAKRNDVIGQYPATSAKELAVRFALANCKQAR